VCLLCVTGHRHKRVDAGSDASRSVRNPSVRMAVACCRMDTHWLSVSLGRPPSNCTRGPQSEHHANDFGGDCLVAGLGETDDWAFVMA